MFKQAITRFFLPVFLLGVLITPANQAHAQSATPLPQSTVITGTDPEPPGEPDILIGTDVITGTDPEPPGEPDGLVTSQYLAALMLIPLSAVVN